MTIASAECYEFYLEESFEKNQALYAHLTYKDVERFRNGSFTNYIA